MVIVISGPTGTGKSALALSLCEKIGGEIINCDAFQVYEGLKIATAYPSEESFKRIKHHLYGFVPLDESYSIGLYQKDCRKKIEEVLSRGKVPVLVGGSGLYIRAALYDYDLNVDTSSIDLSGFDSYSNEELHRYLALLDKNESEKIHPNNRRRVLRAIAICLASKENKTDFNSHQSHAPIYETKFFWLSKPREELYPLVEKRVDEMFDSGLLEETIPLIQKYGRECNAFQAIGVKELFPYIDGEIDLEQAKKEIKTHTRQYIKRQETFLRHQFDMIEVKDVEEIYSVLRNE